MSNTYSTNKVAARVLVGAFIFLVSAYLIAPPLLQRTRCPPQRLAFIPGATPIELLFGLAPICFGFFLFLCQFRLPIRAQPPIGPTDFLHHKPALVTIGVSLGIMFSAYEFLDFVNSYTCVMINEIDTYPGALSTARKTSWESAISVRAACGSDEKNFYHWSRLSVYLRDRTLLPVYIPSQSPEVAAKFMVEIKSALTPAHYSFQIEPSVTPDLCLPYMYKLLSSWNIM